MNFKRSIVTLFIGLFVATICESLHSAQETQIDTLVQDVFMSESSIPGVSLTVVQNSGKSVFARGYGYADVARNLTADGNTKFLIASITKVSLTYMHNQIKNW